MKNYLDRFDVIKIAVKNSGRPAVYIANHLEMSKGYDYSIWRYFCDKVTDLDTRSEVLHGGLFLFDNDVEARDFYTVFESGPIYASGIYAMLIDGSGEALTENT